MSENENDWGRFLDRLAHDLREPLRAIHTFSELLNDSGKGRLDPECDRFLEEILGGSSRISVLVDGLSQYALALEEQDGAEASLQLAFNAAVAALDKDIRDSGAVVTSDPLPRVGVKLERLIQLMGNLIGNSIRFRRLPAPQIHVAVEPVSENDGPPDQWMIHVIDNGIGLAPDDCEAVFKPFARIHGRKYPGAGLGLTICRRIIETHGGTIRIEAGASEGSVVSFTLPAA